MEPTRIGLLVLGAVAISSTTLLVATQRGTPAAPIPAPLAASPEHGATDPSDLAALVSSIERLIDALGRGAPAGSPSRLEAASPAALRQPAPSSDETSIVTLLEKLDERLATIQEALRTSGRGGVERDPRAGELRSTVEAGPRPSNVEAWKDYFARYPPASVKDVPIELAVLGVADVLERFGWPQESVSPTSSTGNWELVYRDIAIPSPDGVVTTVRVYCSREGTYYVRTAWH